MSQATLELDYEQIDGGPLSVGWGALFSECGTYRYRLWRRFDTLRPPLVWLMLNPSTADQYKNDPTVARCQRRAQQGGFGSVEVLNLFALRATDPRELYSHADPIGPKNDAHIAKVVRETVTQGGSVVCAWGVHGTFQGRAGKVARLLREEECEPLCLGMTRDGHPRHPLYVGYGVELVPWEEANVSS